MTEHIGDKVALDPAKERSLYGAMQALRDGIGTPDTLMAHVKRLLDATNAQAWFAGYDKGNLDGYFGTHDERDKSPYADRDPNCEPRIRTGGDS